MSDTKTRKTKKRRIEDRDPEEDDGCEIKLDAPLRQSGKDEDLSPSPIIQKPPKPVFNPRPQRSVLSARSVSLFDRRLLSQLKLHTPEGEKDVTLDAVKGLRNLDTYFSRIDPSKFWIKANVTKGKKGDAVQYEVKYGDSQEYQYIQAPLALGTQFCRVYPAGFNDQDYPNEQFAQPIASANREFQNSNKRIDELAAFGASESITNAEYDAFLDHAYKIVRQLTRSIHDSDHPEIEKIARSSKRRGQLEAKDKGLVPGTKDYLDVVLDYMMSPKEGCVTYPIKSYTDKSGVTIRTGSYKRQCYRAVYDASEAPPDPADMTETDWNLFYNHTKDEMPRKRVDIQVYSFFDKGFLDYKQKCANLYDWANMVYAPTIKWEARYSPKDQKLCFRMTIFKMYLLGWTSFQSSYGDPIDNHLSNYADMKQQQQQEQEQEQEEEQPSRAIKSDSDGDTVMQTQEAEVLSLVPTQYQYEDVDYRLHDDD